MSRPRQQRATGIMRGILVAAVLLAMLCLARVNATTASSLAGPSREKGGVATAVSEVGVGQGAAAAEQRGAVVPERLDMEVSLNDYQESRANGRHNPSHP